jgi:hypothetical protein
MTNAVDKITQLLKNESSLSEDTLLNVVDTLKALSVKDTIDTPTERYEESVASQFVERLQKLQKSSTLKSQKEVFGKLLKKQYLLQHENPKYIDTFLLEHLGDQATKQQFWDEVTAVSTVDPQGKFFPLEIT